MLEEASILMPRQARSPPRMRSTNKTTRPKKGSLQEGVPMLFVISSVGSQFRPQAVQRRVMPAPATAVTLRPREAPLLDGELPAERQSPRARPIRHTSLPKKRPETTQSFSQWIKTVPSVQYSVKSHCDRKNDPYGSFLNDGLVRVVFSHRRLTFDLFHGFNDDRDDNEK